MRASDREMTDLPLPIDSIRRRVSDALSEGPVVITAPTGSGKSTQVPRWCRERGRVLVVEPRRVACRGLAARVAELEGCELGREVGYAVRDDNRSGPGTSILFATPGVVLRMFDDGASPPFDVLVIDEFHERSLDVDLILALGKSRFEGDLLVMSATMDAERLARHLGGSVVSGEGRTFPVEVRHVPGDAIIPDARGLEGRLSEAIRMALGDPGDILVFLPGKAEIARARDSLSPGGVEVLELHGGLSLARQSEVFNPGPGRRIILSTNVAETSITVPGVGVVVDSGLVRRTRYVNGRGHLTLVPVAMDSAEQRAGRSGRTAPGVCYRLWSPRAVLEASTPPEIFRESLSPLLLAAGSCHAPLGELPFLDPPRDYALEAARADLVSLGAVDDGGGITPRGRRLFGLPLDAALGNLLVEAEVQGCLDDAVDLVAALAVGRPLFRSGRPDDPADDLRAGGCDGVSLLRAVREGNSGSHGTHRHLVAEARSIRSRLRRAFDLPKEHGRKIDRDALVRAALASDPRCAQVARRRKGRVFWGNGSGAEVELAKESAVDDGEGEALAILQTIAMGEGHRRSKIFATCAMPVRLAQLVEAGLGVDRVEHVAREGKGRVTARVERVFAGKVIDRREEVPLGALAREAVARLLERGSLFAGDVESTRGTLESVDLLRRLRAAGLADADLEMGEWEGAGPVAALSPWLEEKLEDLGLETGDDLALLSNGDFLARPLPERTQVWLDKNYPRELRLGDGAYRAEYDLAKREVTFTMISGTRKDPPSLSVLPTYRGFRVRVRHHSKVWVLKG